MGTFDNHFALVVGVDKYPAWGADKALKGAIADAQEVARWLQDTEIGGGLLPEHVKVVPSGETPPRPLDDDVDDALEALLDLAERSAPEGRRLYFYFSGHGAALEEDRGLALCLAKWSTTRRAALDVDAYVSFAQGYFDEVVFFLDCCRNRVVKPGANGPEMVAFAPGPRAHLSRRVVGYATEYTERSFEVPVGPNQYRGIFTSALLAALRQVPDDEGVGVPLSQLAARVAASVPRLAKGRQLSQRPQFAADFDAAAEPRFGQVTGRSNVVVRLSPGRTDVSLIGGDNQELQRGGADSSPWTLRLTSSLLFLVDHGSGDERYVRHDATSGEVTDVSF